MLTILLIVAAVAVQVAVIVVGSLRHQGPASRPCLRCEGSGRIRRTGHGKVSCPMCHGSGRRPLHGDGA
jgi:DnaJ-class molecular chaperone